MTMRRGAVMVLSARHRATWVASCSCHCSRDQFWEEDKACCSVSDGWMVGRIDQFSARLSRTSSILRAPTWAVLAVDISRLKPASSWKRSARSLRSGTHEVTLRSEEHTSELQSQSNLVCRLLLEKKKKSHLT